MDALDVDLISPKFLPRGEEVESPQSLVSSWSQLDSGTNSRLEELCLPDSEDLQPCQASPEPATTQVPDLENCQEIQDKLAPNNCDSNEEEREIMEEEEEVEENDEEKKEICDKENCTPEETEETGIKTGKKKNKKRRKHAKKKPQASLVVEAEAETDLT